MRDILTDLVAEQQSLDQFLQKISIRDWKRDTPAKGWTIHDTVSHLATFEEYTADALTAGGTRLAEAKAYESLEDFTQVGVEKGRRMRPQDTIDWWREARASVVDALSRMNPSERVPWLAGNMSARTMATARLMETWAHGLDIYEAMEEEVEDTIRLRHIAWLGWRALPYAFRQAGEEYSEPVRVEVIGPAYQKWVFGPADSSQVIKGEAGEWCRVAVRRMSGRNARNLTATGEVAETALRIARAYV